MLFFRVSCERNIAPHSSKSKHHHSVVKFYCMREGVENVNEQIEFPNDVGEKLDIVAQKLDLYGGNSSIDDAEKLLAEAYNDFDKIDSQQAFDPKSKSYREIKHKFKDSLILRVRHEIKEQGAGSMSNNDQILAKIANQLRDDAKRAGNIPPYESALNMISYLLIDDKTFLPSDEAAKIRGLLDAVSSESVTPEQAKGLRRIKSAAKGISTYSGEIRSAEEILNSYHVTEFAGTIKHLARMYQQERSDVIKKAANTGGLGSAEVFDVESDNAGGFAGPSQARRPRRYGDSLDYN